MGLSNQLNRKKTDLSQARRKFCSRKPLYFNCNMDTSWIFSLTTHPTDFVLSRLYNDIGQFLFFFFFYLSVYLSYGFCFYGEPWLIQWCSLSWKNRIALKMDWGLPWYLWLTLSFPMINILLVTASKTGVVFDLN